MVQCRARRYRPAKLVVRKSGNSTKGPKRASGSSVRKVSLAEPDLGNSGTGRVESACTHRSVQATFLCFGGLSETGKEKQNSVWVVKDGEGGLAEPVPPELLPVASRRTRKSNEEPLPSVRRSLISWHYDLSTRKRGQRGAQSRFGRPLRLITRWPAIRLHPLSTRRLGRRSVPCTSSRETFRRKTQDGRACTCAAMDAGPVDVDFSRGLVDASVGQSKKLGNWSFSSTWISIFSICGVTFFPSPFSWKRTTYTRSNVQSRRRKQRERSRTIIMVNTNL